MIRILPLEQSIVQKMSFGCREYCPLLPNRLYVRILDKRNSCAHYKFTSAFLEMKINGQNFIIY